MIDKIIFLCYNKHIKIITTRRKNENKNQFKFFNKNIWS